MTKDRTHRADRLFRPERSAQQTYRMQILQPLTVGNIRFAPRHVLHVARVDQHDSETSRLQDLKKRNPVDSRRFHRHRLYVAGLQPIRSGVQVFGKRREMPYRLRIAIHRHGDINLRRPYVHTGSIIFLLFFRFLDMALLLKHSAMRDGPDCAEQSTLLNGIDVPQ